MGTVGQFEIDNGNSAGRFLLDDNGKFKICGNCCDACINMDAVLFSPTGYKIKDYYDGMFQNTCSPECTEGTAVWDGSFPFIKSGGANSWGWCVQANCPFYLSPPLCINGKQLYGYYTQITFFGGGSGNPCWKLYISSPGWTIYIANKAKGKTPKGIYTADKAWMDYIASCVPSYPATVELVAI